MKPHIYFAALGCLTAISANTQAQTTQAEETKTSITTPKFTIGFNAVGGLTSGYHPLYPINGWSSDKNSGGEIFARYFIGKHWAMETGVGLTMFDKGSGYVYLYDAIHHQYDYQYVKGREMRTYVPLTFQYHLLNNEARLRPYFSFGAGWEHIWFTDNRLHNYDQNKSIDGTIFMQIGQGLTCQINKNWQLNESLTVRSGLGTDVKLKFGVGYSFR